MAIQSSIHTINADKDFDQERGEIVGIMRLSGTKIAPAFLGRWSAVEECSRRIVNGAPRFFLHQVALLIVKFPRAIRFA